MLRLKYGTQFMIILTSALSDKISLCNGAGHRSAPAVLGYGQLQDTIMLWSLQFVEEWGSSDDANGRHWRCNKLTLCNKTTYKSVTVTVHKLSTILMIISLQGKCRPLSSTVLPRTSFVCTHIIAYRMGEVWQIREALIYRNIPNHLANWHNDH